MFFNHWKLTYPIKKIHKIHTQLYSFKGIPIKKEYFLHEVDRYQNPQINWQTN